ncbi:MAG: hypothetical protein CBC42_06360 [Betaproteobacteria bacterium TMED82]|nr:MAG: hypothetical protein CBC42_06360 [Betaproteobacteria bacterium TMED82]
MGILFFGVVDRIPWKGPDLYGTALIKNCDGGSILESRCVVPNISGNIIGSEGPLFFWLVSSFWKGVNYSWEKLNGFHLSSHFLDDFARIVQIFFIILGLMFSWFGVKKLALRRESRPIDPLGIGPNAQNYSSNIATCSLLLNLSCLGSIMQWHEISNVGLSFFFQAIAFFALTESPEKPEKNALIYGLSTTGLLLSAGVSTCFSYWFCALFLLIFFHPWNLVKTKFLLLSFLTFFVALSGIISFLILEEVDNLIINRWFLSQITGSSFQPLYLIKTWLWTWWPLWPIIFALLAKLHPKSFKNSPHLILPIVLFTSLTIFPLSGVLNSAETKFIPILPLSVLAAFGLLSLPRGVANLIDWFALSIFSLIAVLIWTYWIALHTGTPNEIYQDAIRAAPVAEGKFRILDIILGVMVTMGWLYLILWRMQTTKPNLWRPVVLSAGGLAFMWTLLITLWGPALNVNRGFSNIANNLEQSIVFHKKNDEVIPCINIKASDLKTQAIVLAYTNFSISDTQKCQYFLIRNNNRDTQDRISETEFPTGASQWSIVWQISRYGDPRKREKYSLFSRLR